MRRRPAPARVRTGRLSGARFETTTPPSASHGGAVGGGAGSAEDHGEGTGQREGEGRKRCRLCGQEAVSGRDQPQRTEAAAVSQPA